MIMKRHLSNAEEMRLGQLEKNKRVECLKKAFACVNNEQLILVVVCVSAELGANKEKEKNLVSERDRFGGTKCVFRKLCQMTREKREKKRVRSTHRIM